MFALVGFIILLIILCVVFSAVAILFVPFCLLIAPSLLWLWAFGEGGPHGFLAFAGVALVLLYAYGRVLNSKPAAIMVDIVNPEQIGAPVSQPIAAKPGKKIIWR